MCKIRFLDFCWKCEAVTLLQFPWPRLACPFRPAPCLLPPGCPEVLRRGCRVSLWPGHQAKMETACRQVAWGSLHRACLPEGAAVPRGQATLMPVSVGQPRRPCRGSGAITFSRGSWYCFVCVCVCSMRVYIWKIKNWIQINIQKFLDSHYDHITCSNWKAEMFLYPMTQILSCLKKILT